MTSFKKLPRHSSIPIWFRNTNDCLHLTSLFLFGFCLSFGTTYEISNCENSKYIERQALGRTAELGTIYDDTTDTFSELNFFKEPFDNSNKNLIRTTQLIESNVNVIFNASLKEAFSKQQINANIAVNLLSGLVKFDGSARFLDDQIRNSTEVAGVLLYTFKTVEQKLQLNSKNIEPFLTKNTLHHRGSHVVTGITWGASVAVLMRKTVSEEENLQQLNNMLRTELDLLASDLNSLQLSSFKDQKLNISFSIFGDIPFPPHNQTLSTRGQVLDLLKNASQFFKHGINGKGSPISYRLTSLRKMQEDLQFDSEYKADVCQLYDSAPTNILDAFDQLLTLKSEITTLQKQVHFNPKLCLDDEIIQKVISAHNEFLQFKENYKMKVKDALVCVKKKTCNSNTYSNLRNSNFQQIKSRIAQTKDAFETCKTLESLRVKYGAERNFTTSNATTLNKVSYVLFFKNQWIEQDRKRWNENFYTFSKTLNQSCHKLLVVDCSLNYDECKSLNQTVIKQMVLGTFTTVNDVHNEMQNIITENPTNFTQTTEIFFKNLQVINDTLRKHEHILLHKSAEIRSWLQNFELFQNDTRNNSNATLSCSEVVIRATLDTPLLKEFPDILYERYADNDGLKLNEAILKIQTIRKGIDHLDTIQAQFQIARCLVGLSRENDLRKALDLFQTVHEKRKEILGESHKDTLNVQFYIATILIHQGKYSDALNLADEVYKKQLIIFGKETGETLYTRVLIVFCLFQTGKQTEAMELGMNVFEKKVLTSDHSRNAVHSKYTLAWVLNAKNKVKKALSLSEDVYRTYVSILGEDNIRTMKARINLAGSLERLGELSKVLEIITQVFNKMKEVLGPYHRDTLRLENNIANTLGRLGKIKKAQDMFQKLYDKQVKHFGKDDPETLRTAAIINAIKDLDYN